MNDSTKPAGIKLAIDWLKGIRMHIPHSKWVMFTIGVYVLAAALGKAVESVMPLVKLFVE